MPGGRPGRGLPPGQFKRAIDEGIGTVTTGQPPEVACDTAIRKIRSATFRVQDRISLMPHSNQER